MTAQAGLPRSVVMTGSLTFAAVVATCISMMTATAQSSLPDYTAIIAAPDRTEADLQTDKRRDPLKLLAFAGARPGMKVLDMGAGGGYSTELMPVQLPRLVWCMARIRQIFPSARRRDSRRG